MWLVFNMIFFIDLLLSRDRLVRDIDLAFSSSHLKAGMNNGAPHKLPVHRHRSW